MKRTIKIIAALLIVSLLSLVTVYALNNKNMNKNKNTREYPCYTCNQTGKCSGCKGTGKDKAYTINGTVIIDCGACNGTGRCKYCGGDGIKGN